MAGEMAQWQGSRKTKALGLVSSVHPVRGAILEPNGWR